MSQSPGPSSIGDWKYKKEPEKKVEERVDRMARGKSGKNCALRVDEDSVLRITAPSTGLKA